MTRNAGLTLFDLMAYVGGVVLVGAATFAIVSAADRDRRAVTAVVGDSETVRVAAGALAADVRAADCVRVADGALNAGTVRWSLLGDELVRRDLQGARTVARRVSTFEVEVDRSGVVHATIGVRPSDATAPAGAVARVAARPFLRGGAR